MPNPDTFTVGLIQMHCSADPDDNLRRAEEKVRSAAKQGAQMVCLPELFRTQYFCQREDAGLFDLAESIPGPTTEALSTVARETKTTVVVSVFERRARGLYHNTAVIL
ncbi:MAG TPA: nitrilase-related carbon-nitrogen hydrolase, partial [Candidatus Angelobacter sp.]|nr:nitrilase-related carbon-nitrogen hydrolase [Candidatus Angelobacter sp.]